MLLHISSLPPSLALSLSKKTPSLGRPLSPRHKMRKRSCKWRKMKRPKLSSTRNNPRTARVSMRKKLHQLHRIIPGCEVMENMETLFQMTANHIFALQLKVSFLQSLCVFYDV
ncbi:hypothetical protein NC652_039939 [Populus alba x Populus x berolinensis]|nr:hypothetical protein NC652_039938 [Populus alba x Populus x berolinensis]KAJ6863235.1 hypothetical protein NC652_039939 [Populus alba x Populus x berolinensis]